MISPPARVPSAHHVCRLTVFLMNWTWPSPMAMFTPPGWLLLGGIPSCSLPSPCVFPSFWLSQPRLLGGIQWLYESHIVVEPALPLIQKLPLTGPDCPKATVGPGSAWQAWTNCSAWLPAVAPRSGAIFMPTGNKYVVFRWVVARVIVFAAGPEPS